jgi:hypothetical protein
MQPNEQENPHDIFGVVEYEAELPEIQEFLPWHRPRKQYVRHYQWCSQIDRLLHDFPLKDGTLKYLGLPGVDLLDLRHFHTAICTPHNVKLRFLGFNSSARPRTPAHTELNVSLDEVRRLPSVDPMSDVIGENFALLANQKTIAWKRARNLGPYDVVNLDLCDGFGAAPPDEKQNSYYDAVNSLLAIQSRSTQPWLLLLTTRADRANVDTEVLQKLLNIYIANLHECQEFHGASGEFFAIQTEEALRKAAATPDGLLSIFLTGLCKWFLKLALAQKPPTSVELRSVIGYRVEEDAEHEDLISIALRFTPTYNAPADPAGLAIQPAVSLDECALATRALRRVAKRVNADKKLADEPDLNKQMAEDTANLLSLARYDVKDYYTWLERLPSR